MKTNRTKAIDLRAPSDEGAVVRKGSRVWIDQKIYEVVQKQINGISGHAKLVLRWAPSHQGEQSGVTMTKTCSPNEEFDEITG